MNTQLVEASKLDLSKAVKELERFVEIDSTFKTLEKEHKALRAKVIDTLETVGSVEVSGKLVSLEKTVRSLFDRDGVREGEDREFLEYLEKKYRKDSVVRSVKIKDAGNVLVAKVVDNK